MVLSKDTLSGLLLAAGGAFILVEAQRYQFGTLARMGPGFFPTLVGASIVCTGVWFLTKGLLEGFAKTAAPLASASRRAVRATVFLLGSIILFALIIDRVGLLIATLALVVTARFASSNPLNWKATGLLAASLSATAALLFWYLLDLPFRLLP